VIVADTHFLKLFAEYDISEIEKADILVVPGSTVGFLREAKDDTLLSWIKKINTTTTWTTSVCSGSIILAAAGLLKDKKATSHWDVLHFLKAYQLIIEYDPKPPFTSGNMKEADTATIELAKKVLRKEAKKELKIWDIVKNAQSLI
jgi:putative intracellular protease/amidase